MTDTDASGGLGRSVGSHEVGQVLFGVSWGGVGGRGVMEGGGSWGEVRVLGREGDGVGGGGV